MRGGARIPYGDSRSRSGGLVENVLHPGLQRLHRIGACLLRKPGELLGLPVDQVEVKLRIGISELWARITPWARDELGIRPDQWLYAQIKSVSVAA